MKKTMIIGADIPIGAQITKAMFEKDRGIVIVEKLSPFEPEPMMIHNYAGTSPYIHDLRDKKGKLLPLPKSKYHK